MNNPAVKGGGATGEAKGPTTAPIKDAPAAKLASLNLPSRNDAPSGARVARVLAIAGSDSSGGAGIQADIKTIAALGAYATTAITAVTVQDTNGVRATHTVPVNTIVEQILCVLADIGADAIKTGMLGSGIITAAVAEVLKARATDIPIVVDPVMVAKGGAPLLNDEAVAVMITRLLPLAWLVTPNAPEAARLTGLPVKTEDDLFHAGTKLLDFGVGAALVKGGHLEGDTVSDVLVTRQGAFVFRAPRIDTKNTRGTGCTLASAIAAYLAEGIEMTDAIGRAHGYVQEAIRHGLALGKGHGPLNHMYMLKPR